MEIKKEILEKIAGAASSEQLASLLKEIGIDLSEKDASKLFEELCRSKESGELSDDELDEVSGGRPTGFRIMPVIFAFKKIGVLLDLIDDKDESESRIGDLGLGQKHKSFDIL